MPRAPSQGRQFSIRNDGHPCNSDSEPAGHRAFHRYAPLAPHLIDPAAQRARIRVGLPALEGACIMVARTIDGANGRGTDTIGARAMTTQGAGTGLRLGEIIAVLSVAGDLGMGMPMEYALRSSVLAVRLGEALGLAEAELADVYYVALLRFVGCTADSHLAADVFGDELAARPLIAPIDWGKPAQMMLMMARHIGEGNPPLKRAAMVANAFVKMPKMMAAAAAHCEVALRLSNRMGLGDRLETELLQLFERWDGKGIPNKIKGEQIALPVRVVFLAQDAIVHYGLGGVEAAVAMARERSGGAFDPRVSEVFCARAETLMADLDGDGTWDLALAAEPGARPSLNEAQIDEAVK